MSVLSEKVKCKCQFWLWFFLLSCHTLASFFLNLALSVRYAKWFIQFKKKVKCLELIEDFFRTSTNSWSFFFSNISDHSDFYQRIRSSGAKCEEENPSKLAQLLSPLSSYLSVTISHTLKDISSMLGMWQTCHLKVMALQVPAKSVTILLNFIQPHMAVLSGLAHFMSHWGVGFIRTF